MLETATCSKCGGDFVVHRLDLNNHYTCGLCHMPSRAGKTKKLKEETAASLAGVAGAAGAAAFQA